MSYPLDVSGRLSLTDENGKQILVTAEKQTITVTLPSLWVGHPMLRQLSNRRQRTSMMENIYGGLKHADLMIEFRIADRIIALVGPQSRPGFLSHLVGFGPVELKIVPILLSLFKR
ncbi:MAG: hypothetical protein ACJAZP_000262 [Psychromonas sp.]|jgi:hypothetical protein|uniref:hypothetical protein n=1 Tax=Psychromonas sp. TaxID=1884585 RepID=UPI0039E69321